MAWKIWTDDRGLIWAEAGTDLSGFNDALADSISALSPNGSPPALSTYWIDQALRAIADNVEIISGGNATVLLRNNEKVVARSNYELFDDEHISVGAFVEGLHAWRAAVARAVENKSVISLAAGVTYWAQRNPRSAS